MFNFLHKIKSNWAGWYPSRATTPVPVAPPANLTGTVSYTLVTTPPTFTDDFSAGALDATKWIVSDWGAPQGGLFKPSQLNFSQGLLRIELSQSDRFTSIGGEIQSREKFGYGTYEFIVRAGSNSPIAVSSGVAVSGGVTGMFNFVNNSETEIDFEIQGNAPEIVYLTNYQTTLRKSFSSFTSGSLENRFVRYKFVWAPGRITFFMNDQLVGMHEVYVPAAPAFIMLNHWGVDNPNWGGVATPGIDRFMFVKSVRYWRA